MALRGLACVDAVPISSRLRRPRPITSKSTARPATLTSFVRHRCIGWRLSPELAPYRREFMENGRPFDVAVEPQLTTRALRLMLRLMLAGAGITFAPDRPRAHVDNGSLVPLLEAFLPQFPGSTFRSGAIGCRSCGR